ncbi:unnamed protein product [Thlaspi arvense]|uniref:Uncharacterized protein n=1 Tax=Thlaspi arvense TaxID=13288 RepID=A0AAU9RBL6_THLAR|nr:unnamed protein product [Thlaspi arvense]
MLRWRALHHRARRRKRPELTRKWITQTSLALFPSMKSTVKLRVHNQEANNIDKTCIQLMLIGRIMTDGKLNARVKCDTTEPSFSLEADNFSQLTTFRLHLEKLLPGQVASTDMAIMNYVSLATEFMYNIKSRDVVASVGYDYILRQCRLRGKIDSNSVTSAYLEEYLPIAGNVGLQFLLSAEVDHVKKDYKFGFGVTLS